VDVEVLLLVGNLVEAHCATVHGAGEGLLQSMHAEMIKEIVPFFEHSLAAIIFTSEYCRHSAGRGVVVFNQRELTCVRYVICFDKVW
jgi:hypothetical protein